MNEVYFPPAENVTHGLGSCYYINHGGKVRFHEINQVCLDSTNRFRSLEILLIDYHAGSLQNLAFWL